MKIEPNEQKTIVISDSNDEVLIAMFQDMNGNYIVVEPSNGSIKAEVWTGNEPMFNEINGRLFINRRAFIIHT